MWALIMEGGRAVGGCMVSCRRPGKPRERGPCPCLSQFDCRKLRLLTRSAFGSAWFRAGGAPQNVTLPKGKSRGQPERHSDVRRRFAALPSFPLAAMGVAGGLWPHLLVVSAKKGRGGNLERGCLAGSSCCQHPQKHPDVTESLQNPPDDDEQGVLVMASWRMVPAGGFSAQDVFGPLFLVLRKGMWKPTESEEMHARAPRRNFPESRAPGGANSLSAFAMLR